jgi:Enoyl-(Acyl carrier protein) reductase
VTSRPADSGRPSTPPQATYTILLGVISSFLSKLPQSDADRSHTLRKLSMIPLPGDSREFARRFGVDVWTLFNMTELNTRSCMLATEFGRDGIRVNAVAPGLIWSPGTDERIKSNAWWHRMMIEGCPLGRVGQPEEIGEACAFLASDAASFINGVVLPVDGGWSIAEFLPMPAEA